MSAGDLAGMVGLSPRVRGNPDRMSAIASGSGSIPACAGEPLWYLALSLALTVYPRVCGGTNVLPPTR